VHLTYGFRGLEVSSQAIYQCLQIPLLDYLHNYDGPWRTKYNLAKTLSTPLYQLNSPATQLVHVATQLNSTQVTQLNSNLSMWQLT
jgi:hypothetical protein